MVGLSKPARGPGWVIPTTAATALHLLLFGCVYLNPPTATLSDTQPPLITVEVSLAPTERAATEAPPVAATAELEAPPAESTPVKRQFHATRAAKIQPSAAVERQLPAVRPAPQPHSEQAAEPGSEPGSENENAAELAQAAQGGSHGPGVSPTSGSSVDAASAHAVATKPRLLSAGSTCHGVISEAVFGASAKVTLVLQVAKDGSASTTAVRADSPAVLPGLTKAAHECARRLRFAPARAANGERVVAPSMVRLTISKHYSAHAPRPVRSREGHI